MSALEYGKSRVFDRSNDKGQPVKDIFDLDVSIGVGSNRSNLLP